jgi:hypothetical protein
MKKMSMTFPLIPSTGVMVLVLLAFSIGCSDEPIGVGSSGSTSQTAMSEEISADELVFGGSLQTFNAHLTGEQERPAPVSTDGSGQAIFKLSKDGNSLYYKVVVNNLENITQAHIHCGGPEVAGPVVTFLFGFVAGGVTKNGVLAEGTITSADIIVRPDTEVCMGGVASFDQLIEQIRAGQAYINVHTQAFPAGEVRGIIK